MCECQSGPGKIVTSERTLQEFLEGRMYTCRHEARCCNHYHPDTQSTNIVQEEMGGYDVALCSQHGTLGLSHPVNNRHHKLMTLVICEAQSIPPRHEHFPSEHSYQPCRTQAPAWPGTILFEPIESPSEYCSTCRILNCSSMLAPA